MKFKLALKEFFSFTKLNLSLVIIINIIGVGISSYILFNSQEYKINNFLMDFLKQEKSFYYIYNESLNIIGNSKDPTMCRISIQTMFILLQRELENNNKTALPDVIKVSKPYLKESCK